MIDTNEMNREVNAPEVKYPLVDKFLKILSDQVNRGIYVWGGNGELLDDMADPEQWIARHESDIKDEKRAIALYRKRVASGIVGIRAFDCSGLVYWALKELGLQKTDVNSRGFYSMCKKLSKNDILPGDLVFHSQGGTIVHVGVFAGNDKYIECKGRDDGVVCGTRKKNYWDKFGRFEKLWEKITIDIGDVGGNKPLYPTITIKGGSVNVRNKPTTVQSTIIGIAHRGDVYRLLGVAENGWYKIDFKGMTGWISNRSDLTEVVK